MVKLALTEGKHSLFIRKKALLCLLRIYRKYKEKFNIESWVKPIESIF